MRLSADTNIFVYLTDERSVWKQAVARDLVESILDRDTCIGLQVVGELQNALVRRLGKLKSEAHGAASFILATFDTAPYDAGDVEYALAQLSSGELSYWDALLVSATRRAGCSVLFSEDMQHGRRYGALEIVNPFGRDGAMSARAREILAV